MISMMKKKWCKLFGHYKGLTLNVWDSWNHLDKNYTLNCQRCGKILGSYTDLFYIAIDYKIADLHRRQEIENWLNKVIDNKSKRKMLKDYNRLIGYWEK